MSQVHVRGSFLLALTAVVGIGGVARTAHAQDYIQQIEGPAGTDAFGHSLATDGTTLVVGDPQFKGPTSSSCDIGYGAVEVYKLTAGTWQLNQSLSYSTPNTSTENNFGNWVSLRNNVLVVSSEREDYLNGSTSLPEAGAFYVFRRTSATAQFTQLARIYSPNVEDGAEFTMLGGVATNGTYIAAAESPSSAAPGQIYVYQIQGNNVVHVSTITSPVNPHIAILNLYITTSNALIVSLSSGGTGPTPYAYQLNGTQVTSINTSSTSDLFGSVTPYVAGDGNTVVVMKISTPPSGPAFYYPQVIKFGTSGVISHQNLNLPLAYFADLPAPFGALTAPSMTVKENQAFFIGYQNIQGVFNESFNFVTGWKYLSGTGFYYPAGVVRNDLLNYPNTFFASSVTYDGTYLYVGDPGQQWSQGIACSPLGANGAVDVLRPVTSVPAGPSGSKELQPWLSETDEALGQAVATNGTFTLAGSAMDGDGSTWPGEATLFENITNQWQQVDRYIDGYDPLTTSRGFATSVDISTSGTIAIGAPSATPVNNNLGQTGAVYTGTATAAGGPTVGPLLTEVAPPSGTPANAKFGQSVSVTGSILDVGAPYTNGAGGSGLPTRGAVYVYSGTTFSQEIQPAVTDGNDYEGFGTAVDASGNNLIVGIPYRNGGQSSAGAVQIFSLVSGRYVSSGKFSAPSTFPAGARLGSSVAIGASYAIAGTLSGSVVVYRLSGSTWVQDVVVSVAGVFDFGQAVALEGSRFVTSSVFNNRVYRYERNATSWQQTGTISRAEQRLRRSPRPQEQHAGHRRLFHPDGDESTRRVGRRVRNQHHRVLSGIR